MGSVGVLETIGRSCDADYWRARDARDWAGPVEEQYQVAFRNAGASFPLQDDLMDEIRGPAQPVCARGE